MRDWRRQLFKALPVYSSQFSRFLNDTDKGFQHSEEVLKTSMDLVGQMKSSELKERDLQAIEDLAVFHDIGKFFEELHSLDNIKIAQRIYQEFAGALNIPGQIREVVADGIIASDFYNIRLDPGSAPPRFLAGDIVRCADKMQDNLVRKVDRYWFEYGVPRGATFFDETLSYEERAKFSFDNFAGDQLNVILSIIGLRPTDFSHCVLQRNYEEWSHKPKQQVVSRILSLAREIGYNSEQINQIESTVRWYRKEFNC